MAAELASFVPYRKTADGWEFYLQMRDGNAPIHAHMLSTFGGHIEEGEDSLTGVLREIKEELDYEPRVLRLLGAGDLNGKALDMYVEEVGAGFEETVVVHEGEYGVFVSYDEISARTDVTDHARVIVAKIIEYAGN